MANIADEAKVLRLLQVHGPLSVSQIIGLAEMDEETVKLSLSHLVGERKIHLVYDLGEKWVVGRG